ncbi:MAG: OmpA family protein [Pseudobdellovibrionaceae bacterium]
MFLVNIISARTYAGDFFGGYLSGNAGVGQFGSPSAAVSDRYIGLTGVDSLLGINFHGATFGLHLEYDYIGQLTPRSQTSNTNSKGTVTNLGLGLRYFWTEDYYTSLLIDFGGEYIFAEKTISSEDDKLQNPQTFRLKVGKRLNLPYLVTVDGDLRYGTYSNFHISGRNYDWSSKLWSLGVGLTWHFGKAPEYVPPSTVVKLEEKKIEAKEIPVETKKKSERIVSQYTFSAYHYRVNAKMIVELKKIAAKIKDHPGIKVEVQGYSDTSGTERFNKWISTARAESVRDYLIHLKINPDQITAVGMSNQNPANSNDTKKGRAANRRYEIILISEG